jgi:hypothetical protein
LLRWFDRYPVRVEIKGSSRPSHVERVWITSNVDPRSWYPELDLSTQEALMRRLQIEEMTTPYNITNIVYINPFGAWVADAGPRA